MATAHVMTAASTELGRRLVRTELFSIDEDEIDGLLINFIGLLCGKLAEVPEEYREQIQIKCDMDWDDDTMRGLEAWYDRPETDAELTAREQAENTAVAREQQRIIAHEKWQIEAALKLLNSRGYKIEDFVTKP